LQGTSTDSPKNFKEKDIRMLDFRKVLLALSVAGLGLVGSASAQTINCAAGTILPMGGVGTVSVEGTTELLPNVVVSACTGTANSATIVLTSDVPFTDASSALGVLDVSAVATVTGGTGAGCTNATTCPATSVTQSGNTITAVFSLGGGSITNGNITFTGLRVNASAAPSNSAITIGTSGIAGGGISGSIAAATQAFVAVSQLTPVLTGAATVSLCTGATLASTPQAVTSLLLQENFTNAFKTAVGETGTQAGAIAATQGTRLAITFNNLNANVSYYVPAAPATTNALVVAAYAAASGGTALTAVKAGTGGTAVAGQVLLTVTNGSATIYYGVTTADNGATATITVPLIETISSPAAVTTVSSLPVTANSVLVGVATGYPQYVSNTTPTTISQPALPATNSILGACATTLLFPYVTNSGGFDTGIAIANASTGTSAPNLAITPTTGSCNVTFYGAGAPTTPYSTGSIPTATDAVLLVSIQAPGLSGYAVAVCNFAGAHGYAFITDGFGGGGRGLSADYLAVVLASAGTGAAFPIATF
jgi:hypothetical protein